MRVLFVISSLSAGGAERVMSRMATHWAEKGWEVVLLTHLGRDRDFYPLHPRVNRIALNLATSGRRLDTMLCLARTLAAVRRQMIVLRPDVVVSFTHKVNILTLISAIGTGIPVVVSERVDPTHMPLRTPLGRAWSALRRLTYRRAAALVMQTANLRTWAESLVPAAKVWVIGNPVAVPDDGLADVGIPDWSGNTILAAGRLTFQKGFDLLLPAFAACDRPDWRLIIAGRGEKRHELEKLALRLGISDRVVFAGLVADLASLMRKADIFVMSSRLEGFSNVLCEAMACGLPVISFDCPSGPREIVRDGVDGIIVPPEDVNALSSAMSQLISDESERRRMGGRAVEITERYGVDRVMASWEKLLSDVTGLRDREKPVFRDLSGANAERKSRNERIALFLPSLRGGGAERVMVDIANGLAARGVRVDMLLARAEGIHLPKVSADVRAIDLRKNRVISTVPSLVRYLRRERPGAVLSTLEHANVALLMAARLARTSTRVIIREANTISRVSEDAANPRQRYMPRLMRLCYRWADRVVAVSQGVRDDLVHSIRVPDERMRVIYNPIAANEIVARSEAELEHPWFAPDQPPVVLGVGRLSPQKDFSTLIRAFALAQRRTACRLMILGEGTERESLEKLIGEVGLQDEVSLPGLVENPYQYMARCGVFALSSRYEGLPNVLIEAMACGAAVISTDCESGPREILDEGKYGALTPVGDCESLAAGIMKLLDMPPPADLSRRGAMRFDTDSIVDQYMAILLGDE
ncbi:MAG: glycosyltransferase [Armatimonadetes bacterium]|nr:glycosyltransferase [Armatimonadota bacterium]